MIIYFTGTGNSRYIAGRLADMLCDSVTDAARLIKEGEHPSFYSESPYVFVAPTYAWRFPKVFKEWLSGCRFDGNKNAYYVLTCGSEIGGAANYLSKPTKRMGLTYMGTYEIVMPENYLIMFTPTDKEDDAKIISAASERLIGLCDRIRSGEAFERIKVTFKGHLYSDLINPMFYTFYVGADKFYATDGCISCGKCESACMLNNIKLKNGRPVWGKSCTHCLACICTCPAEAIEYGKNTKGRRRYYLSEKKQEKQ